MSLEHLAGFQQQQMAFAAYIRNPEQCEVPAGIEQRRMSIYAELFYNGMEDHLSRNFPVLRSLFNHDAWHRLVRDFFSRHPCKTALFTQIGLEFVEYLQQERTNQPGDWPFMPELAHYEYVELAVQISNADEQIGMRTECDPNGDLLDARPILAPTAWNLSYQYPVHQIGPEYLPEVPPDQPTHLVVYRDRLDAVRFLNINPITQRLLILLQENPHMTGRDALQGIVREIQHPQPQHLIQAGAELLADLRERNVIWGSRPHSG